MHTNININRTAYNEIRTELARISYHGRYADGALAMKDIGIIQIPAKPALPKPKQPDLSVDHLYGFVAFMTTRPYVTRVGSTCNAVNAMELLTQYLEANGLGDPSSEYPATFKMPGVDHATAE